MYYISQEIGSALMNHRVERDSRFHILYPNATHIHKHGLMLSLEPHRLARQKFLEDNETLIWPALAL